ncbi:DNA-formamidopyrimidine glycosylase family protein [Pedobacter agri]|uniref:DNA-formamidopyrimidine glycosylase family protein n=1 Tax=Pedobacter agri TaxID=454586 RepID=UPI002930273E|nr:DNA-formamidopyrimidine glycosylase family protein [Pedobacter agri]
MAELPDLSVFAKILYRRFQGKTLEKMEVTVAKKLNVSVKEFTHCLEGQRLENVSREGKTLQLHFSANQVLGIHLMLRGQLVSLEVDETPKYQILGFHFKGGEGFAVVDLQKQATPTLNPQPTTVPDALEMDEAYFLNLLFRKRRNVKTLMMDQGEMRGIGNSYADEILYHAGISPFSIAKAIPRNEVKKLYKSLHHVLKKAIRDIEMENGDELKGELRDFMRIHGAGIKETAKGEEVLSDRIVGRKTYFVKSQHLYN